MGRGSAERRKRRVRRAHTLARRPTLAQQLGRVPKDTPPIPMEHPVSMWCGRVLAGRHTPVRAKKAATHSRHVREILLRARVHIIDGYNVVPRLEGVHHGHGGGLATGKCKPICAAHPTSPPQDPSAAIDNEARPTTKSSHPQWGNKESVSGSTTRSQSENTGGNKREENKKKGEGVQSPTGEQQWAHRTKPLQTGGAPRRATPAGGHATYVSHPQGTLGMPQSHPGLGC